MKKIFTLAFASSLILVLAACNTVDGAGRDVESAGEAIQDSAN